MLPNSPGENKNIKKKAVFISSIIVNFNWVSTEKNYFVKPLNKVLPSFIIITADI